MTQGKKKIKHKTVQEQQQCPNCRARAWCRLHNPKLTAKK